MSYDRWKATNPDDEFLGPEPPRLVYCYTHGRQYDSNRVPLCPLCEEEQKPTTKPSTDK